MMIDRLLSKLRTIFLEVVETPNAEFEGLTFDEVLSKWACLYMHICWFPSKAFSKVLTLVFEVESYEISSLEFEGLNFN